MNSLREVLEFVGVSGPKKFVYSSFEMKHGGAPQPTMRWVGNIVPVLNISERTSMRTMLQALQNLPPISLEADADDTEGEVPVSPLSHPLIFHTTANV
jgi:hypothetical protein